MRKVFLIIGLFLFVAVVALFLFGGDEPVTNSDSSGESIVAFGDSLIQGVGATKGNDLVSLLSRRLDVEIVNLGVSGNTTQDGRARLDEVLALQPRIVVVLLGGNDSLKQVPVETTFSNLDAIVRAIHDSGSAVLLVGIQSGILRDRYDGEFERLSQEHRTAFVPDILDGIIGTPSLMSDVIHPNDEGYARMADRIEPVLRALIIR